MTEDKKHAGNGPELSIVIGFKDWGLDRLCGAVRSISMASKGASVEVVVADYGSEDNCGYREALESLGAVYRYVETNGVWSRSRALNAGLAIARGRFLLTTDADMVFTPGSFARIVELLRQHSGSALVLQCRDLPEGITHEDILGGNLSWGQIADRSKIRPRWGMGGLMAFDRTAYHELRGLDERMEVYGGEDMDLAKRLAQAGRKWIWVTDPAVNMYHVWHPSSRTATDSTPEGRAAIEFNRTIHRNDNSLVRNLRSWKGRPDESQPLVTVGISTFNRHGVHVEEIGKYPGFLLVVAVRPHDQEGQQSPFDHLHARVRKRARIDIYTEWVLDLHVEPLLWTLMIARRPILTHPVWGGEIRTQILVPHPRPQRGELRREVPRNRLSHQGDQLYLRGPLHTDPDGVEPVPDRSRGVAN